MRHTRIVVTRYGGPESLQVVQEERPEPKAGEVRVRVLAAGVALPDVMAREGTHPETPPVPFTPGWDLVGVVDRLGAGAAGIEPGQTVTALPISGAYAEFVCLPQGELVPVPPGLDPAEVVCLGLNYITAYQMLHRSAKVSPGQRVLIHGAAGGVGTALLQLGSLAGLEMYGTCSSRGASTVSARGGIPIDSQRQDFVEEIRRLTGGGGWTPSSTPSAAPTSGIPARRSALAGRWWATAWSPRYAARGWPRADRVVASAFAEPPASGCTSPPGGSSRDGDG
jgi:NADPH2:quinone reductase